MRKYRQHGYQDDDYSKDRKRDDDDLKTQPTFGSVMKILRCVKCGENNECLTKIKLTATCNRCGTALHSCVHCEFFDYKAKFQCRMPIPEPVTDKEDNNECEKFSAKFTRDSTLNKPMTEADARRALDRLFKL